MKALKTLIFVLLIIVSCSLRLKKNMLQNKKNEQNSDSQSLSDLQNKVADLDKRVSENAKNIEILRFWLELMNR